MGWYLDRVVLHISCLLNFGIIGWMLLSEKWLQSIIMFFAGSSIILLVSMFIILPYKLILTGFMYWYGWIVRTE